MRWKHRSGRRRAVAIVPMPQKQGRRGRPQQTDKSIVNNIHPVQRGTSGKPEETQLQKRLEKNVKASQVRPHRFPFGKAAHSLSARYAAGLLLALFILVAPLSAQIDLSDQEPFATWEATAAAAQRLLEARNPSEDSLERIRKELADQRDAAFDLSESVSISSRTLQAQMDALGPQPLEGETEPEDVAARRAELKEELAQENAPVLAAQEAYERAQILVRELDGKLRTNQTKNLFRHLPPPIMPSSWSQLPAELSQRSLDFAADLSTAIEDRAKSGGLEVVLPVAAGLAIAGLFLIFFASPWILSRADMLLADEQRLSRRRVVSFGVFAVRLIVPTFGLLLLFIAPTMLGLQVPGSGQGLITALPVFLTYLFIAHLLGYTVFGEKGRKPGIFHIDEAQSRRGYGLTMFLGFFLALEALLEVAETAYDVSPATRSVVATIVVVFGATVIWRLGRFFLDVRAQRTQARSDATEVVTSETGGLLGDFTWLAGRLLQAAAFLAVVSSALGFVNLAREATVPVVTTLGIAAGAFYLRSLVISLVHEAIGETTDDEQDSAFLLPIAVSILIFLAVLPILALIWGARMTDIAEVWRLLTEGVRIGDVRLSLSMVITLVVVFMLGVVITRWTQRFFRQTILPRTKMDHGAQASLVTGLGYIGLTLTAMIAISSAGINLSSLAVVFGALSVGIGFGLRNVVSNFVSGIILLVERPVKVGDWIEVAGTSGIVKKIAVRSTRIETFDRFDVIVPNAALIEGSVKNMTLANNDGRLVLPVGVAYGSDIKVVKSVLEDALKDDARIMTSPAPSIFFVGLGESSLDFEVRMFLYDVGTTLGLKSDLLFRIYTSLSDAGIEIPFPQRDVNLKGLERLADAIERLGQERRKAEK